MRINISINSAMINLKILIASPHTFKESRCSVFRSQDSTVSILTGYGLDNRGVGV
jgi:hypothetical protein